MLDDYPNYLGIASVFCNSILGGIWVGARGLGLGTY